MLNTRFEWAIVFLVVLLIGGAWIIDSRDEVSEPQNFLLTEAPIVGHLAPDFTTQTTANESYSLSSYVDRDDLGTGQPVVLNFWASWCGPCRMEMPAFDNVSRKYAGRAAILGINQAESAETIERFGLSTGVSYPLLVDEDWTVNRQYGVTNLPTTIFVDGDGVIREVFVGTMNQAVLEDKLNGLLQ
jgi:cytochrome c biogenesis protein CcmG, thiol:disulfide interchange protein DsbE